MSGIDQEQQRLFNRFLVKQNQIHQESERTDRIVLYKVHKESGLGNIIRGYVTAVAVGSLTNRAVQS